MRYQAVLIDFYGTLVEEDGPCLREIIQQLTAAATLACEPDSVLTTWSDLFEKACQKAYGVHFRSQREIELATLDLIVQRFAADLDPLALSQPLYNYWQRPRPIDNAREFLTSVNVPVCIVSNIDNADLLAALNHLGWEFDLVVTSEDCRAYKPRPEVFYHALHLLSLEPDDVVHIGDSLRSDIAGATAVGIDTIWMNHSVRPNHGPLPTFEAYFFDEALNWLWDVDF